MLTQDELNAAAADEGLLLTIGQRAYQRSRQTRVSRRRKNETNWQAYHGEIDFSYKAPFQSREVLPDFPVAVEQIVGTFERALTDNDNWLTADAVGAGGNLIEADLVKGLLLHYLKRLYVPGNRPDTAYGIDAFIGDATKRGILEGVIVAKVFPVFIKEEAVRVEMTKPDADGAYDANHLGGEEKKGESVERFRIAIDLVPFADYFPDPSPAKNFEIHRTRIQLHELLGNPEYDQEAVERLYGKAQQEFDELTKRIETQQDYVEQDPFEIELYEYWGNVIDYRNGHVLHYNVFYAWAGNEIVRKPTKNPNWDGCSPFIDAAILRTPNSVSHKALADHAVPMWRAGSELLNLMLDQAMRGAWGVGQLRPDIMENPEEVADGVPQGYTAVLKPNVPQQSKFYERVDNGEAPQISIEMMNRLEASHNTALATPDMKLGQMSPRQATATETVQVMQSSGSLYESFAARVEANCLEPIFEKCWKLIIQYAEDFMEPELVQILGSRRAMILTDLPDADRYKLLRNARIKVRGLRGVAAKERKFQKLMTIANFMGQNPTFADHFAQTRSLPKFFDTLIAATGEDPELWALDEEEVAAAEEAAAAGEPGGGQLDPELLAQAGGGGSPVGDVTAAEAQRGAESQFAPNNPAATPA